MDIFNIIVGLATIASLIVSIVNAGNVYKIKKSIEIDNSVSTKQNIKAKDITQSKINQVGRDNN